MENIRLNSKFVNGVVGKLVSKTIRKKLGYEIDLKIQSIDVVMDDNGAHLHIDTDADMSRDELNKIIKNYL